MEQLGKNFNPEAADFNLEGVFSLGLHNLAEFIGDLSTNANKELGIEQVQSTSRGGGQTRLYNAFIARLPTK